MLLSWNVSEEIADRLQHCLPDPSMIGLVGDDRVYSVKVDVPRLIVPNTSCCLGRRRHLSSASDDELRICCATFLGCRRSAGARLPRSRKRIHGEGFELLPALLAMIRGLHVVTPFWPANILRLGARFPPEQIIRTRDRYWSGPSIRIHEAMGPLRRLVQPRQSKLPSALVRRRRGCTHLGVSRVRERRLEGMLTRSRDRSFRLKSVSESGAVGTKSEIGRELDQRHPMIRGTGASVRGEKEPAMSNELPSLV